MKKIVFIMISITLLTGCPVKGPEHNYTLTSIAYPKTYSRSHLTLLVAPIDSTTTYNTTQMAYTIQPYQISYFAKNAWVEPPPQMLQPLLVQTLQNTHFFHAVTTIPVQHDYTLNVQLLELKQNFLLQPSVIELKLRAQIVSSASNEIIATQQFSVVKNALCRNPYSGVIAANEATSEALTNIALFTVRTLRH